MQKQTDFLEQLSNSDIADIISLTGKLLSLHEREPDRSKAYIDCVFTLERLEDQIAGMSPTQIGQIRLYGKILQKPILEILETGTLAELDSLISITPKGVFDMFQVKGLGVKKIGVLWKELGIDSIEKLKEASESGLIARAKGFGSKTQESILENISFLESLKGKLRLDKALELSHEILERIKEVYPDAYESGEVYRRENIFSELYFLVVKDGFGGLKFPETDLIQDLKGSSPSIWRGFYKDNEISIVIEKVASKDFVVKSIMRGATIEHLSHQNKEGVTLLSFLGKSQFASETDAYEAFGTPYIIPEMRNGTSEFESGVLPQEIIQWGDIKGAVHNHSTYSDGKHTLDQMAQACIDLGFEYFGIADHSQTAAYAGGLWPEKVAKQHREIDGLNEQYQHFKILKGIESDILLDGSLDYETDVLKTFDYVVASVHSVLNMDIDKATTRLLKAIENPYTTILGHPTGRIVLRRGGYPIDYKKIIDACAANKVVMELNASPYRLDLDWTWIDYCLNKGVLISINPDAHSVEGLLDIKYGVMIARKAGLPASMTLNALPLQDVERIMRKS